MIDVIQHEGQVIYVQGYAAIYSSLSIPLDDHDGKRELIRPGACDHVIRNLRASTTLTFHHMSASGTIGSIFDGTLEIWSDNFGLAFSCGPLAVNRKNAWAVRSIVSGEVRGCSWRGIPAEVATEMIDGESVRVIRKIQHLSHISPVAEGMYPGAGTWCSHEHVDDLPDHLKPLARSWLDNRPAPRAQTMPATKQASPARATQPIVPLSRAEQAAKAHLEAKARRPLHAQTPRQRAP